MTINLTIMYEKVERDGVFIPGESRYRFIPISSLSSFKTDWLPACRELGLEYIPHFETGYPVIDLNRETLPPVIDELKRLRDYFVECFTRDGELPYVVKYRLNVIIPALEQAFDEFDEIEYVGV